MATVLQAPPLIEEQEIEVRRAKPAPGLVEIPAIPAIRTMVGTGWLPDVPDLRDYTDEHPKISEMTEMLAHKVGIPIKKMRTSLPNEVDLRQWCSPIFDQGMLGSCTANAGVGIVEYYENRHFGKHVPGSRLFVYKTTRELMGLVGDTGADLHTTMGALVMFGVPLEHYWPYTNYQKTFDTEPTTFVYEMADNYESTYYFCHDAWTKKITPAEILDSVKLYLAYGVPAMFGFWVFPSYTKADVKGAFPAPAPGERAFAGHAVAAVGYNDNLIITNLVSKNSTKGALLIRNSWGTNWGNAGYGWLPYSYVLSQYAQDFWSLLGMKWVAADDFPIKTT